MKTPNELKNKLNEYDDTASAIAVYKEAGDYASRFKEVQVAALAAAQSSLAAAGLDKAKIDGLGSAGYTQPKKATLDKQTWAAAIVNDAALASVQADYDAARAALEAAQEAAGAMKLPKPRFYIR